MAVVVNVIAVVCAVMSVIELIWCKAVHCGRLESPCKLRSLAYSVLTR